MVSLTRSELLPIFTTDEWDCIHTNIVQHQINTGNALPIQMRLRRLPFAKRAATKEKLKEMHAAGAIRQPMVISCGVGKENR